MKDFNANGGQAGFSIITVLVALGVVLTGILLSVQSTVRLKQSSKAIKSSLSYEGVIPGFTEFVHQSVKANAAALCSGNSSSLASLNFSGSSVSLANTLDVPSDIGQNASVIQRCHEPLFNSDGRMYFCLKAHTNSDIPPDAFTGAKHNYAEIAIRMVDKWQRSISCSQYLSAPPVTVGLQIYYRMYWITAVQPKQVFQKSGYYYGIKE
jgi:hypothetical protein